MLKLSLVSRKRTFFARGNEIHYIGGTEILPAPLDAVEEQKMIHMPDALQVPVLASRLAPTTGFRFSGFQDLGDPLV